MLAGCTPWPEELARRYRAEGYWQGITIGEALDRAMRRWPDRIAVIDGERTATYARLVERSDHLAAQFLRIGLRSRDRVIFQLANSIDFFYSFLALLRIGAIPVMALPAHRLAEIGHFARHAEARGYLIPGATERFDFSELAAEVRRQVPTTEIVLTAGPARDGKLSLDVLLATDVDDEALEKLRRTAFDDAGDVALMLLSGGTTGVPKLIPRTHNDYVYNFTQSAAVAGFDDATVYLAVLPLAHNYTLGSPGVLGTFVHGGTVVLASDPSPDAAFELIERHGVTVVAGSVPLAVRWLAADCQGRDLSSLRIFMNGGARLMPEVRRRIEQHFGCTYIESFGTGEGLLNQTRPDDPEDIRLNSSGRPISPGDEIRIIDPLGNELPDGAVGELAVRGPYTIRGYYNAAKANTSAFTADGFYRMGDAVRKMDSNLYVEGRFKDLINRGGEKISAEEVENHVIAHPAVANVCVVAMPDEQFGEKACAFVITRPGHDLDFSALQEFLLARGIAKFKLPERLEVVDAFPLSPAGKVLRRELRTFIARRLESERAAPSGMMVDQ